MAAYDPQHIITPDSTFDPRNLRGKSVVITGGAGGLGEAFTRSFVKHGAFVSIGDLSSDRGNALVSQLGGEEKAAFVKCDVLNWNDQVNLFKTALSKSPSRGVDIVLANAGVTGPDDVHNATASGPNGNEPMEPNLRILNTNLVGVMYTVKLALHYLPRQPKGEGRDRCLIMTGSVAGYLDPPASVQYCASKSGLRGIMRTLRRTTVKNGVRVNMIASWFIRTSILSNEMQDRIAAHGIDFASIEDATSAVMHLASEQSVNGRSLAIVPRKMDARGYMDLMQDDCGENDALYPLQSSTWRAVRATTVPMRLSSAL